MYILGIVNSYARTQQGIEPPLHAIAHRPGRRLEHYMLSHETAAGAEIQLADEFGALLGFSWGYYGLSPGVIGTVLGYILAILGQPVFSHLFSVC